MPEAIQEVVVNALVRFIAAQMPDAQVTAHWPEADQDLPPRGITVLAAGDPVTDPMAPQVEDYTAVDATTGLYTWSFSFCTQPLQIEIWTQSRMERAHMKDQLNTTLHLGELFTLGSGDPVRHGVLLRLEPSLDGFEGFVDCDFDLATDNDSPFAVRADERRATVTGEANFIVSIQAQSPRLLADAMGRTQARLRMLIDGQSADNATSGERTSVPG